MTFFGGIFYNILHDNIYDLILKQIPIIKKYISDEIERRMINYCKNKMIKIDNNKDNINKEENKDNINNDNKDNINDNNLNESIRNDNNSSISIYPNIFTPSAPNGEEN